MPTFRLTPNPSRLWHAAWMPSTDIARAEIDVRFLGLPAGTILPVLGKIR